MTRRVVTREIKIGARARRVARAHDAARDAMRARRATMDDAGARVDAGDAGARTAATSSAGDARYDYEIALGSSGWLFVYYVGVVKAMRERGMARCARKTRARCARDMGGDGATDAVRW